MAAKQRKQPSFWLNRTCDGIKFIEIIDTNEIRFTSDRINTLK